MGDINRMIRMVRFDKDMKPMEKRKRLDRLLAMKRQLSRDVVNIAKRYGG